MDTVKYRDSVDLTEAEDIKKRWQEYAEELYNKDLNDPDQWCDHSSRARHPGVKSQVGLGNITMNKASGGGGIPVELVQILKDDAVKMLHSIYQQIWKTQHQSWDWKRSVFIPIPTKRNTKEECSI